MAQTIVYLGNRDAFEIRPGEGGAEERAHLPGKHLTTVVVPDGIPLGEGFTTITSPQGVWAAHSTGNPAWVASTDPSLAQFLAGHYGCEVREPEPDDQAPAIEES